MGNILTTDDLNNPQPGYYRMRLVRGGPWCPVWIYRERGELHAYGPSTIEDISGKRAIMADTADLDIVRATWERVYGAQIDEDKYHALCERMDDPAYRPLEPTDWAAPKDHNRQPGDLGAAEEILDAIEALPAALDHDAAVRAVELAKRAKVVGDRLAEKVRQAKAKHLLQAVEETAQESRSAVSLEVRRGKLLPRIHAARLTRPDKKIATDAGALAYGKVGYTVEVTDIGKVPTEFLKLTVDETAIKKAAKARSELTEQEPGDKITSIPGVVVHVVESTVVK